MKLNFSGFGRKLEFAVMEASGFLSLALIAGQKLTPENPWPVIWIAAIYALLVLMTLVVPGKRRLAAGVLGCALLALAGYLLLDWRTNLFIFAVPLMYAVLLILGLPVGGLARDDSLPSLFTMGPLAMQALAQIILFFNENTHASTLEPVLPGMNAAFLVYALTAVLALNRFSLAVAAAKGAPAPASVKRRNLLMTLALGAITLAIACFPALAAFLKRAGQAVGVWIAQFILWLSNLFASPGTGGTGGGPAQMMMPAMPVEEPGLFAKIAEKIAIVLAVAVALVVLFFALRILVRKLRILFGLLMARLSKFAAGAAEDYIDEISDTREDGERTRLGFRRRKKAVDPLKGIDESALAPGARIRFHYLKLMLRHPDWGPGSTARENLAPDAAGLYEKARYSNHEVTPADAEAFSRKVIPTK